LILNNTGKVKGKVYLIKTKSETDKNLFKSTEALGKDYNLPAKSTKWKTKAANLDEKVTNSSIARKHKKAMTIVETEGVKKEAEVKCQPEVKGQGLQHTHLI
jgi:hypothetical protein